MLTVAMSDVTLLIEQIEAGNPTAAAELLPLVYDELRKLAAARLASEQPGHTLSATSLVHEAYIRLVDADARPKWQSCGHFFSAAAEAMRRILVEHARAKKSAKRGGGWQRIELTGIAAAVNASPDRLLALNEALDSLAGDDEPSAQVANLRLFAGMTLDEVAAALGRSRTTVHRQWTWARAWLKREMNDDVLKD